MHMLVRGRLALKILMNFIIGASIRKGVTHQRDNEDDGIK